MNLDVLVLGAGPAGSVLAHRLASKGFQVAVVESRRFPRYTIGETLTPGVEPLLKQAQILSPSASLDFPRTTGNLSAWGSSRLHYSAHSQESKVCGFQVERAVFDSMLMANAQRAGASLLQSCWPTDVDPEPAGWRVKIRFKSGTSRSINARFLCDATGRSRFLARRLRLGIQSNDRLVALTAYWKQDTGIASADGCNTLVESIPEGWFYTAGLAENRRVTGLMTDRDLLPAHLHSCARRVYSDALARTKHGRERHAARHLRWHGADFRRRPDLGGACCRFQLAAGWGCGINRGSYFLAGDTKGDHFSSGSQRSCANHSQPAEPSCTGYRVLSGS